MVEEELLGTLGLVQETGREPLKLRIKVAAFMLSCFYVTVSANAQKLGVLGVRWSAVVTPSDGVLYTWVASVKEEATKSSC